MCTNNYMYNEFEFNMYYYTIELHHCLILPEISVTIRQSIGNAENKYHKQFCSSRGTVLSEKKEKKRSLDSKMALRTICAAVSRSRTELGVNNARTFVTTGIEWSFAQLYCVYEQTVGYRALALYVRVRQVTSFCNRALFTCIL